MTDRSNMTREELLDEMIRHYGFEHPTVIKFASFIKWSSITDKMLQEYVNLCELEGWI